jgi:hypothetical protein
MSFFKPSTTVPVTTLKLTSSSPDGRSVRARKIPSSASTSVETMSIFMPTTRRWSEPHHMRIETAFPSSYCGYFLHIVNVATTPFCHWDMSGPLQVLSTRSPNHGYESSLIHIIIYCFARSFFSQHFRQIYTVSAIRHTANLFAAT